MFGNPWTYVAALAIVGAALGGAYQTGHNAAMRTAKVATITAERDAAKADLATARDAAKLAQEQSDLMTGYAAANAAKVKELGDALRTAPDRCKLGSYARQLRDIR